MATLATPLTGLNTKLTISKAQRFMGFVYYLATTTKDVITNILSKQHQSQEIKRIRNTFIPGLIDSAITIARLEKHESNLYNKLIDFDKTELLEADYEQIRKKIRENVNIRAEIQGLFDLYCEYAYPGRDSDEIDDGRVIIAVYELLTSPDGIDFDYSKTGDTEEEQLNYARIYIDTDNAKYSGELPTTNVDRHSPEIFMNNLSRIQALSFEQKTLLLGHVYKKAHPDLNLLPRELGKILERISKKHLLTDAILTICKKYNLQILENDIDAVVHGIMNTSHIQEGDAVEYRIQSSETGAELKTVFAKVTQINRNTGRYENNTTYNLFDNKHKQEYIGVHRAFISKTAIRGVIRTTRSNRRSNSKSNSKSNRRTRSKGISRSRSRDRNTTRRTRSRSPSPIDTRTPRTDSRPSSRDNNL